MAHTKHIFSADRPISNKSQDLLERKDFSESLAKSIVSWKGRDSLVIGLYGAWGSGKTSIKNMTVNSISEKFEEKITVVEFNPWQWSGQDHLMKAFFNEIGKSLGVKNQNSEKLSRLWKVYSQRLSVIEHVAKGVGDGLSGLLTLFPVLGVVISSWFEKKVLFNILLSITFVLSALPWAKKFSAKLAKYYDARSSYENKTLQEIKGELAIEMARLEYPMLVVIDDVDRLAPDDIGLMFQLIKANADFPNLVYLVLFQRNIVTQALENISPRSSGEDFLKKIIQVDLDIPTTQRKELEKVLFGRLDKILSQHQLVADFDQHRWTNIYLAGVSSYFNNLRDVFRFLGTFEFYLGVFERDKTYEVNLIDLIVVEAIRVFDSAVYHKIQEHKQAFVKTEKTSLYHKQCIEEVINLSQCGGIKDVLILLFPSIESILSNHEYDSSYHERYEREQRICHGDYFDRYFHMSISGNEISRAELNELLDSVDNRERLKKILLSFNQRGLLEAVLTKLEAYKTEIPIQHANSFITALMDIGDDVTNDVVGFTAISPQAHLSRIIYWYLRQEEDEVRRGQILIEAVKETSGLYSPIYRASQEFRNQQSSAGHTYLVSEADSEILKNICLEKIREKAKSGGLIQMNNLAHILFCWLNWTTKDEVGKWVKVNLKKHDGLMKFLTSFLHKSTSHVYGEHAVRLKNYVRLTELERFVELDYLYGRLSKISLEGLSDKESEAISCFNLAYSKKLQGKVENPLWGFIED